MHLLRRPDVGGCRLHVSSKFPFRRCVADQGYVSCFFDPSYSNKFPFLILNFVKARLLILKSHQLCATHEYWSCIVDCSPSLYFYCTGNLWITYGYGWCLDLDASHPQDTFSKYVVQVPSTVRVLAIRQVLVRYHTPMISLGMGFHSRTVSYGLWDY